MIKIEIFKLFGSILVDNDKANQSIDATDKKADSLGNKLGTGIQTAAKWGAAIFAGATVAVGGMIAIASKASDAASAINDMSVRTGISTDTLQELKFATEQVGVNFESITNASGKLNKTMADAANGSKTAKESFGELGVEVNGADGKLRSMGDVFPEVISKLADMENKSERNALAMKFFGKGAVELVPLLDQGSGGIEELTKKAHDLGLVMGKEAIEAGDKFGDSMDAVKSSVGMLGNEVGITFMPIIQKFLDWILLNMPAIKETASIAFNAISIVVTKAYEIFRDNILPILAQLFVWVQANMPTIKSIVSTVFQTIWDIVKQVWDIFSNNLLPILKDLYSFIEPTFPLIGKIIETAFEIVVASVKTVVDIFDKVTSAIKTAIKWLKSFNDTDVESKDVGVSSKTDKYQHYAKGTDFAPGGLALVGEKGAELVNLPRGSQVYTNQETKGMLGNNQIIIENMNVRNDNDIELIARRLYELQQRNQRALGVI